MVVVLPDTRSVGSVCCWRRRTERIPRAKRDVMAGDYSGYGKAAGSRSGILHREKAGGSCIKGNFSIWLPPRRFAPPLLSQEGSQPEYQTRPLPEIRRIRLPCSFRRVSLVHLWKALVRPQRK